MLAFYKKHLLTDEEIELMPYYIKDAEYNFDQLEIQEKENKFSAELNKLENKQNSINK